MSFTGMKKLLLFAGAAAIFVGSQTPSHAQSKYRVYVAKTPDGFETNIMAAVQKKKVPVALVTTEEDAEFVLAAAPVEVHKESTGSKVARCIFAYCAGIQDTGNVSVQLINRRSHEVAWAYQVTKQNGGGWNRQSMAEAIAKHMRKDLFGKKHPLAQTYAHVEKSEQATGS